MRMWSLTDEIMQTHRLGAGLPSMLHRFAEIVEADFSTRYLYVFLLRGVPHAVLAMGMPPNIHFRRLTAHFEQGGYMGVAVVVPFHPACYCVHCDIII